MLRLVSAPRRRRAYRLPRARTVVALAAALATGACSALVDLDGLGGGEPLEAGAPRLDAGARDGGGFQPLVPDDADASPGPACEAGVHFCDDFERGEPRGAWTRLAATGDSGVAIGSEASGNRFLEATVAASEAGRGVELVQLDDAGATAATLRARVRFASLEPTTRAEIVGLARETNPAQVALLAVRDGSLGLLVTEGAVSSFVPVRDAAGAPGEWHAVELRLTPPSASLRVDGAEVTATFAETDQAAPAGTRAFVGLHFVESAAPLGVDVDDVALSR